LTFPDTSTCTLNAWVKSIGTAVPVGAVLEMQATLRVSGATTWVFV
jgi:hypothetical protein